MSSIVAPNCDWQLGQRILGQYTVRSITGDADRPFAEGGMGRVYRLFHEGWGVDIAAKVPKADADGRLAELFATEAQVWSGLSLHPHVVSCHYVRRVQDTPVIFAEFIDGGNLQSWIQKERLYEGSEADVDRKILDIAMQMARGLHHAHGQGLIHGDFKPANVMMAPDGEAKVTDFGQGYTRAYYSPEQAAGLRPLTRATDVWSWAVSVLEMLMGEIVWSAGPAAAETLEQAMRSPDSGRVRIHEALAEILSKCLSRSPGDRFQTMAEIDLALRNAYQSIVGGKPWRPLPRMIDLRGDNLNNKALSALDLGDEAKALRLFDQALKADQTHLEAIYNYGLLAWRAAGETDISLLAKMKNAGLQQKDGRVEYLSGLVHLERGDVQGAIRSFEEAAATGFHQAELEEARCTAAALPPTAGQCLKQFQGHTGNVTSVAFVPSGREVLSAGWDGVVRVWDLRDERQLRVFEGHEKQVGSAALTADARILLTGSGDQTVRVWNFRSSALLQKLEGHESDVECVDVSGDGRWGVSGSRDKTIVLWDLAAGREVRRLKSHSGGITGVKISRDGAIIFSSSSDGTLLASDANSGRVLWAQDAHQTRFGGEGVSALAISGDGRLVLTGGWDGKMRLWDSAGGAPLRSVTVPVSHHLSALALSADGTIALSDFGGRDFAGFAMWDMSTGRCLRIFQGHTVGVNDMAISPDMRTILTGASDNTVRLWDLTRGQPSPHVLSRPRRTVALEAASIRFKETLVSARRWIEKNHLDAAYEFVKEAMRIEGYSKSMEALDVLYGIGARSRKTGLSDAWMAHTLQGHQHKVSALAFSPFRIRPSEFFPDQRYLLSGDSGGWTWFWNVAKGQSLSSLEHHPDPIATAAFYSGCNRVYLRGRYGKERVYDSKTGQRLWSEESALAVKLGAMKCPPRVPVTMAVIADWLSETADGPQVVLPVVSCNANSMEPCDEEADPFHDTGGDFLSEITSRAKSFDGRTELCCTRGGALWAVHPSRPSEKFPLETSHENAACVAVFPDGRFGVSGHENGVLRIWDIAHHECVRVLEGHNAGITCLACAQNGRWIASGSDDRTIRIWQLKWDYEIVDGVDWDDEAGHCIDEFRRIFRELTSSGAVVAAAWPQWISGQFEKLLTVLECVGLGYLNPQRVREQCERQNAPE